MHGGAKVVIVASQLFATFGANFEKMIKSMVREPMGGWLGVLGIYNYFHIIVNGLEYPKRKLWMIFEGNFQIFV